MTNLTSHEYWKEIGSIASDLVERAMTENDNDRSAAEDQINNSMLHEDIDGHQWVIYYAYNLSVLDHSENSEYADEQGLIGENPLENGLNSFHTMLAFWAMYGDVQDYLSDAFDEYEAKETV